MSDVEDVPILKKSTRLSMKKGPQAFKAVKPKAVKEPEVEVPKVVEPEVVVPVKKEKKPRVKKEKPVPVLTDSDGDSPKVVQSDEPKVVKKVNGWIVHCREYRAAHPDIPYKQCLSEAKQTYKKA